MLNLERFTVMNNQANYMDYMRVRGFTQDDAHIFCTQDQVEEEFKKVIDLVLYIFKTLKFENFKAQISLRDPESPEKYIGSDENWE